MLANNTEHLYLYKVPSMRTLMSSSLVKSCSTEVYLITATSRLEDEGEDILYHRMYARARARTHTHTLPITPKYQPL